MRVRAKFRVPGLFEEAGLLAATVQFKKTMTMLSMTLMLLMTMMIIVTVVTVAVTELLLMISVGFTK